MTIAIAGNFTEGIVMGADSSVTYTEQRGSRRGVSQLYEGAQKIYHLGSNSDWSDSPYGVLVFGAAAFAGQSWRNIFANFWRKVGHEETISASRMSVEFCDFLTTIEADKNKRPNGGLFLAGFGETDNSPQCFRIDFNTLSSERVKSRSLHYDGMPYIVQRLLWGTDNQTEKSIQNMFGSVTIEMQKKGKGSGKEDVPLSDVIIDLIQTNALKCKPDTDMPLRDAIDYIDFLVYSTIKHFKFNHAAQICGGSIELAAITLDRGFRRIRTKLLDSALR